MMYKKNDALVELAKKELEDLQVQIKDLGEKAKKARDIAYGAEEHARRLQTRVDVLYCIVYRTPLPKFEYAMGNTD